MDPFDGYVTYRAIQQVANDPEVLKPEINTFEKMVSAKYPRYRYIIIFIALLYVILYYHTNFTFLYTNILFLLLFIFHYRSSDPLDLGEALWITHMYPQEEWARHVSHVSLLSLEALFDRGYFNMPGLFIIINYCFVCEN